MTTMKFSKKSYNKRNDDDTAVYVTPDYCEEKSGLWLYSLLLCCGLQQQAASCIL